ncbi:MAG: NAD-dependent epimerase/dehydratase family protein [Candidatus Thermoplasmatota archaeon]|nr:NAD-dependent epimerase/dehydratase family protein [Candidatus Thermoplasmatota archaeon]MDI6856029.1 NAD-dependent epimerase/dehydratase family protein [Candidatus Thermoplasmatota archaeon]MDI6887577.1 NAD-dependent epimerase/dehydratase family protein [Candidatus Thermoplasmatota archaeon]
MEKKILVTGGAGFIGSHLVDRLLRAQAKVTVYDNLATGNKDFLKEHFSDENFRFIEGDLLDLNKLKEVMRAQNSVFHLAANSDVKKGTDKTNLDLEQNIIATHNVLEAMRLNKVKKILFPSTCTVYGENIPFPIPEGYAPLLPISLYGASKLACEALICAYCHSFDFQAWIVRLANIVGSRATHGIVLDFINKLNRNKKELEILGDGKQRKSYMLVEDCIDAMLFLLESSKDKVNIFNLATEDTVEVNKIAEIVVEEMHLKEVSFRYTGSERGWRGDIPKIQLSIEKLKKLGWKPRYNSEESIRLAVRALLKEN